MAHKKTRLSLIATAILISFVFNARKKRLKIKKSFDDLASSVKKQTNKDIKNWKSMLFNSNNFNFKMFFNNIAKTFTESQVISRKKIKEVSLKLTDFFSYTEEVLFDSLKDVEKIKIFKSKKLNFEQKLKDWIGDIKNFKNEFLKEVRKKAKLAPNPSAYEVIESFLAMEILDILHQKPIIKAKRSQVLKRIKSKTNRSKKKGGNDAQKGVK